MSFIPAGFGGGGQAGSGATSVWTRIGQYFGDGVTDTIDTGVITSFDYYLLFYTLKTSGANMPGIRFNGDAGNNYNYALWNNNAYSVATSTRILFGFAHATDPSIGFLTIENKVAGYGKGAHGRGNRARTSDNSMTSGCWNNAVDRINQIQMWISAGHFDTDASFVLFGVDGA